MLIVRSFLIPVLILMICLASAGCSGNTTPSRSTYSVDSGGTLTLSCAPVTTSEEILFTNDTYTKSRIILHTENGDVVTYLAAPKMPKAAILYVPGAGEKIAGHEERMVRYASAGYAFLFVDIRGNGGETAGNPFSQQLIQEDYARFEKGEMPQYYLSICDLISAQKMLAGKFQIPVYAMGSSNGGRYATVAAGIGPQFAGYVGISTSDWGLRDSVLRQGYTGDTVRFATSIEPGTYIGMISPRPVWIFHAEKDPIIPFGNGQQFFAKAQEPKTFLNFSGDHGINSDVDGKIIGQWAQIYAPRE
ncbi:alpha/beta hydrolase [uncultured Methanoregula sp.]|uniref:alpha/beta hydrolase n=1 Tax=uncultured Methanoregula sp. TaxID=1005933 RepID=UPI002AAC3547|nr:alpha/beta hydrolase [uncultured Methanoregula sp.]